jgi:ribA/ribD-fused uncharacterized protein
MIIQNDILEFQGDYRWLSNFYRTNVQFEGEIYPTSENAYQGAKVHPSQRNIFKFCDPGKSKRLPKTLGIREDWDLVKVSIMEIILRNKFYPNSPLAIKLQSTGNCKIIEGNSWNDTFWGVCKGIGENNLGKLLMNIRDDLNGNP